MVEIRPYELSDFPAVKGLLEENHMFAPPWEAEENLAGMVKANPNAILVAIDQESNMLVGNVFVIPYGPLVAILFRLAVKEEFRKQGLASRLIMTAQENVIKAGAKELGLFADVGKKHLQEFYVKRGFVNFSDASAYQWKDL